jgi:succinate-semialdehyde dehydrogenase / glutarate-semialdehyde dehydrogenase
MESRNPATGELVATIEEHSPADVAARLAGARAAFPAWRDLGFAARARHFRAAAAHLKAERDRYARLMTEEMGKPIAQAEAEIEKCAWGCDYYAENAARFLAPEPTPTDATQSLVRFDPLGVILAVMPWNFPFWQVFRFAAPALMAGNVGLLKHASNVPRSALAIQEVFEAAGFPPHVFTTLLVSAATVESLIRHPDIAAATLTGSEAAGESVGATAGGALKKVVLELGGSDPFVVLTDADLDAAATTAVEARMINNGQSCIAAKRFIAVGEVADGLESRLRDRIAALKVGDPLDRTTQVGPLARPDLVRELDRQVKASVAAGARVVVGGAPIPGPGAFYQPTLLADVRPGMPVFDEETFGPVAALSRAADESAAIALANQNRFGLGASLWTRDTARAEALAARIEAGLVFVNAMVKSDPRLPFGGVKRSGHGRELGEIGIREFVNVKSVWVA